MLERTTAAARAALIGTALAALVPATAAAHGGTTIADGRTGGVTILVQGSDSTTASGKPAVDLATSLAGPGSGSGSKVVYYVRPDGGKSVRVSSERDEGGVHHVDVATADRGDWRSWDVSAIVTLGDGKRLRVTNAESNPPGPDPAQASEPAADDEPAESTAPSTPTATEVDPAATSPAPDATTTDDAPIQDVDGDEDGAPAWALPSVAVIAVLGLLGLGFARRRSGDGDAGDDWDAGSSD